MAPITLTYTSHPAPSQHINAAVSGLRAQLPLRNLHWKPSTRTSLRTIQEVDVELVELGDVPTGARSGLGSVIEQPLVNLCLVVCEVSTVVRDVQLRCIAKVTGLGNVQEPHKVVHSRLALTPIIKEECYDPSYCTCQPAHVSRGFRQECVWTG